MVEDGEWKKIHSKQTVQMWASELICQSREAGILFDMPVTRRDVKKESESMTAYLNARPSGLYWGGEGGWLVVTDG
jgi:hypothetical protein